VLNLALSLTGVGEELTKWVTGFGLSQTQMLLAFIVFYIILGMFMDTLSMMVATIPLSFPVATSLGVAAGEHVTRGPGAGRAARARPAALSRPRA
jgi:TRAP-type C4-dicarboxylate transport system permease large subunit